MEGGCRFLCDPLGGQKTGWFYDQRDNRAFAAGLAEGARVLDLYAYLGGFGARAALAGAREVVMVDRSRQALELAGRAAGLNGVGERVRTERADAFAYLEAAEPESFGLVIADPPAFVRSRKDLGAGLRGYRKLARLAARPVAPGGFLLAASCSHNVTAGGFRAGSRARPRAGRPHGPRAAHGRGRPRPPGASHAARIRLSEGDGAATGLSAGQRSLPGRYRPAVLPFGEDIWQCGAQGAYSE